MAEHVTDSLFNPYPGLRSFQSDEDYLFFGREDQTGELLRRLGRNRFVAVVGTSGSGKSSLVRCGLLSELQGGGLVDAGSHWEIAVMHPGGDPLRHLAESLIEADLYDAEDPEAIDRIMATLRRSDSGLVEAARQSELEDGGNLVVVVDQFEEIFRFHQAGSTGAEEAPDFIKLLLEASRNDTLPIYVVLTMRSDFLGDCSGFAGLAEAVNDGEYLIPRLNRDQMRTAIEGPAKVAGGAISWRLLVRLLNDVEEQADRLPVLQHALMRMWDAWARDHEEDEPLDLRHYERIGGLSQALSIHADEVFDSLPDDETREVAEKVFRALTEKGTDNRGVRRPSRLEALDAISSEDRERVRTVINAYRQTGVTFLMPGEETPLETGTVVDISHESLMRVWQRLNHWVEEEAQSVRIYRRLKETADLWKQERAGLYHDPDLQIAQSWREDEHPNAEWAQQYGGGFEATMAFLDQSAEAARAKEHEAEVARQRELKQAQSLAETQTRAAANFRRFAVGVGLLALVALGLSIWAFQLRKDAVANAALASQSAQVAEEEKDRARAAEKVFREEQGDVWLERSRAVAKEKDHFTAKMLAGRALGFTGMGRSDADDRFKEAFPVLLDSEAANQSEAVQFMRTLPGTMPVWRTSVPLNIGKPNCVAYDPQGNYVAAATLEGTIYVWDAVTGEERYRHEGDGQPVMIEAFRDGETLLVAQTLKDQTVVTRRYLDPQREGAFPIVVFGVGVSGNRWTGVGISNDSDTAISADHRFMALACKDGKARLIDGESMQLVQEIGFGEDAVRSVAFHPEGNILATGGSSSGTLTLWQIDLETNKEAISLVSEPAWHSSPVGHLCFSKDGSHLVSSVNATFGGSEVHLAVVDPEAGALDKIVMKGWQRPSAIEAHPTEANVVAVAGFNVGGGSFYQLRQLPEGEVIHEFFTDLSPIERGRLAFSPDGSRLFSAHFGGAVQLIETGKAMDGLRGFTGRSRFSPDGRWLVVNGSPQRVYDMRDGTLVAEFDRMGGVGPFFSHDGQELFLQSVIDRRIHMAIYAVGEFSSPKRLMDTGITAGTARALAHSKSNQQLAYAFSKEIAIFDMQTEAEIASWENPDQPTVLALSFSPDGAFLASGGMSETTLVWNVATQEIVAELETDQVLSIAFSPDGRVLATAGAGVDLWDMTQTPPVKKANLIVHEDGFARWIAFSPDGSLVASCGDDHAIRVWDTETLSLVETMRGGEFTQFLQGYFDLAFTPDGRGLVATEHYRNVVTLWELGHSADREGTSLPEKTVSSVAFLDEDTVIGTGIGTDTLYFVAHAKQDIFRELPVEGLDPEVIEVSPDGNWIACFDDKERTILLDLTTGEEVARFDLTDAHADLPTMAFSPDSRVFAMPTTGKIELWFADDGTTKSIDRGELAVSAVAFSPDGQKLYAANRSGWVEVFDMPSSSPMTSFQASDHALTGLAISGDGAMLATTGIDQRLRTWNAATLKPIHESEVGVLKQLNFHPTHSQVAAVDTANNEVRLWDLPERSGELSLRQIIPSADGNITDVAFSPSGRSLACTKGKALHVVKLGETVNYAHFTDNYEIKGRRVLPRAATNLLAGQALPFQPKSADSYLAILRDTPSSPEETNLSLFEHFMNARSLESAQAVYLQLSESQQAEVHSELMRSLAEDANRLADNDALSVARLRIDEASKIDDSSLYLILSKLRVALKENDPVAVRSLLDEAIIQISGQESEDTQISGMLQEMAQECVDQGQFSLARDVLGVLLGLSEYQDFAQAAPIIREYYQQLSDALLDPAATTETTSSQLLGLALIDFGLKFQEEAILNLGQSAPLLKLTKQETAAQPVPRLIPRGASWAYHDALEAPPEHWKQPEFDDSQWGTGTAPLGFGQRGVATSLKEGGMTYYMRHAFTFTGSLPKASFPVLQYCRDDGIVVYLNGEEFFRCYNMPSGKITHETAALATVNEEWHTVNWLHRMKQHLRQGENVLAVEVHQRGVASSDLYLDLELTAELTPMAYLRTMTNGDVNAALESIKAFFPARQPSIQQLEDRIRFCFSQSLDEATPLAEEAKWVGLRDRMFGLRLTPKVAKATSQAWTHAAIAKHGALRINCGDGGTINDENGTIWHRDLFRVGYGLPSGAVKKLPRSLDIPEIYRSARYFPQGDAATFYRIHPPAGRYQLRLHFIEAYVTEPGKRVQDILINDQPFLEKFDILAEVEQHQPLVKETTVEIQEDELLSLKFVRHVGNLEIAGIELIQLP